MRIGKDRTIPLLTLGFFLLLAANFVMPKWLAFLVMVSLARSLVVIGVVVLMRSGLVSFGQGFFYCIGGYTAGIASNYFGITDISLVLLISIAISIAAGGLIGLLLCNYREIFFAMLTLAVSMILYSVIVKNPTLGGSDGFNVSPPHIFGISPDMVDPGLSLPFVTCIVVYLVAVFVHRYFRSGFGYAGVAIRLNEIRVEYLGASPKVIIYSTYILAGVLASIGGTLIAYASGHVDPELAYWTTSGEFVFVALLGGVSHVAAPVIASVLFQILRTYALDLAPYIWQMLLGIVLLLIILFLPEGLWSIIARLKTKRRSYESAP